MATDLKTYITPEEYLLAERASTERKHEWINGEIREMNGAKREHNLVELNVSGLFWQFFRSKPNEVYPGNMRVRVPDGPYYYPDVVVSDVPPQLEDDEHDTLRNPLVVVEILSPSTESIDRGEKFGNYSRIPSLTDYLLVAQDHVRIDHFQRQPGDEEWSVRLVDDLSTEIVLERLDCRLAVREIYERVIVTPDAG